MGAGGFRAGTPVPGGAGVAGTLDDVERQAILAAIRAAGGNKTRAAMSLGISLRALYRKLEKYAAPPGAGSGERAGAASETPAP
jgi:DNA-binding NtrC family response regulator